MYKISPSFIEVSEISDELKQKIIKAFSFKNKAAEYELRRFIKAQSFKYKGADKPEWFPAWYAKSVADLKSKINVCACKEENGTLRVPIGLLERLKDIIGDVKFIDNRDFDPNRKHLPGKSHYDSLRKPQKEAIDALKDKHTALILMATGVGKTRLAEEIIWQKGVKSIFLVPSRPILDQTVRRFKERFGNKFVGEYHGGKKQDDMWITVATYQSVFSAPKGTFDEVSMVLADEVHHIGAETFYGATVENIPNAIYRYGLTAFEERADGGTILVHAGVGDIAYEYSGKQAIDDGFLAKPTFIVYNIRTTQGTYKKWKMNKNKREEIGIEISSMTNSTEESKCYKNWVLGNDKLTKKISDLVTEMVNDGMSVLILIDEKEHADKFRQFLTVDYEVCVGGDKENQSRIDSFNNRELKLLIGTSTLGEGTDLVPVDVLINLQGGASMSRTKQADGRALRNDPDPETGISRKPTCIVIDFSFPLCDTLLRHSEFRTEVHQEIGEVIEMELI